MSIPAVCPGCRARYRVPEIAAGKRTTCKKCGQSFRIPAAEPEPQPATYKLAQSEAQFGLPDLDELARGETVETSAMPRCGPTAVGGSRADELHAAAFVLAGGRRSGAALAEAAEATAGGAAAYGRYLAALVTSLAFFRKPANLITFIILWILLAGREVMQMATAISPLLMAGIFGTGAFIVRGWYMAFKMNLVQYAAAGDEEFPRLAAEEGFWDGVLVPCFWMLAVDVFAFLPAGLFLAILNARIVNAVLATAGAAPASAGPTPGSFAVAALVILALLGLFAWPMMVLVVACGTSIRGLFRLDLMVETMFKSLPAYLLTVLAVYVAAAADLGLVALIWRNMGDATNWRDDWIAVFVLPTVLVGLTLFFDVIAMRAIGYYYLFFKHKFAWSWG